MWHESLQEMKEMIKSIIRMDKVGFEKVDFLVNNFIGIFIEQDFFNRQALFEEFGIYDKDFYEWQTQIFFDDAFKLKNKHSKKQVRTKVKVCKLKKVTGHLCSLQSI